MKIINRLVLIVCFCIGMLALPTASAQLVQAEGNALIGEAGIGAARQFAIKDAMRQAALQAGARVKSSSQVSESVVVSDSVQVRATGLVKDVVVLDEWINEDDDIYYVMIRAFVSDSDDGAALSLNRYRKKVAVTQFAVSDRRHIADLPGIEIALAKELMRRLTNDKGLISVDGSQYLLFDSAQPSADLGDTPRQAIVDLANRLGSQFIVTGTIRDMGTTSHPLWVKVRHVELESQLWDGVSGTIISQERVNASVWDWQALDFPTTAPAFNDKFFASPIGKQINLLLDELVRRTALAVDQLPFMARVIKSEGKNIYFDVGATSEIKVGDVFMAYKLAHEPLMDVNQKLFFGYQETPAASIVIKSVQPRFAVGVLEGGNTRLYAGDVIRFQW